MDAHIHGGPPTSNFISVTAHPEAAAVIAQSQKLGPNMKTYVFKLRVPKLDLVYAVRGGFKTKVDGGAMLIHSGGRVIKRIENDARLESVVNFRILPGEIEAVTEVPPLNQTYSFASTLECRSAF